MNRQSAKFKQDFSNNFLNHPNEEDHYHYNDKPVGSGHKHDPAYELNHIQDNSNRHKEGDFREAYNALSEKKPIDVYPHRYKQEGYAVNNYNASSEHNNHRRQRQQRGPDISIHHASSYLAGGDGYPQCVRTQQNVDANDVRSNNRQETRQEENQNSGATYNKRSNSSSRFSSSSKETAVERSVGRRGKQLLRLTVSKANLMQTVNEGLSDLQQKHGSPNRKSTNLGRRTSKETFHCESESSNACSSPSAGVINDKIIHPMIKKFRLLYLHNIKEEVSIMEDLETLPYKLNEICRKLEKE